MSVSPPSLSLSLPCTFRLQWLLCISMRIPTNRKQAVTIKGEERYDIMFSKYKKGVYIVQKVVQDPTYGKLTYPHAKLIA